jgi:alpha-amylase/alpha-mannosidase (GH57 family)
MQPVALAILWHQHQPYYPDDVSGETLMPWVRLHGTKDYYGMALHLKEVPEFRCTINLVPSLLVQILRYAERGGSDRHLDVSRMPADGLSSAEVHELLDTFFMANFDNMIRPHVRYHELHQKRGFGIDPVERAAPRFSARDIRDLQVWSNLTWMHELAFERDPELREFRRKGRHWSEKEKLWLLDKQREILRQIVPLHRELAASGQVELTTTPFFHPILPLLWDKRAARQAMPGCELPRHLESYREDARTHLQRAVTFHEELFSSAPVGLWPSEGSVAHEIVAPIAEAGIEWIATDEEILAESTGGWTARDGQGHLRHPEMLYRPWRVEDAGQSLQMVFRDHALSDLIGFHYQRSHPHHAANDLLSRCEAIGRAVAPHSGGRPALVPVILDGENCWEYYPDGGVEFLRTLYKNAVSNNRIRPVRMQDYLHEHPASDRIGRLFAGSWISHNFAIWIGHHEDRTAWDLLHETRQFLKDTAASGHAAEENIRQAWEEIYIAEGSDWYWWFGDDHSSAQDALFDQLFRRHLQNVYAVLGLPWPDALNHSITRTERRSVHTLPTGFLPVKVDGRKTYFEWVSAGRYTSGSERGTMTMVTAGPLRDVHFGFDAQRFFLRVDTNQDAVDDLAELDELRVRFFQPAETEIHIEGLAKRAPSAVLFRKGQPVKDAAVEAAVRFILELGVAFESLAVKPGELLAFALEAISRGHSLQRAPQEGVIELKVPSPDFERMMWQA